MYQWLFPLLENLDEIFNENPERALEVVRTEMWNILILYEETIVCYPAKNPEILCSSASVLQSAIKALKNATRMTKKLCSLIKHCAFLLATEIIPWFHPLRTVHKALCTDQTMEWMHTWLRRFAHIHTVSFLVDVLLRPKIEHKVARFYAQRRIFDQFLLAVQKSNQHKSILSFGCGKIM